MAELLAGGQTRIFIPSVFRNEYVGSLKRLTNHGDPDGFTRLMLHRLARAAAPAHRPAHLAPLIRRPSGLAATGQRKTADEKLIA